MYLYNIVSDKTDFIYIGITNDIKKRFASHKCAARTNKKSPLYDCMRKHGIESFTLIPLAFFSERELAQQAEINAISLARINNIKILNLADGGEGGYVIPNHLKDAWKVKLSKARQGRKPALGMKHTEENKKFFAECNKRKVPTYPNLDFSLGFTKNSKIYGISKTHYYRLLKRAKSNDLS